MSIGAKRSQQAQYHEGLGVNRFEGVGGGGSGLILGSIEFAANGPQGAYSTANANTFADISATTKTIHISRTRFIEIRWYASAHLSAAVGLGYVRANLVGYDVTASLQFGTVGTTNGELWYHALAGGKGPVPPGPYTMKLQAATDNNTFSITIDQFFWQIIPLS